MKSKLRQASLSKALWITGLCLFSGLLQAAAVEEESKLPSARSVVRATPMPTATPEVRKADLKALRLETDKLLKKMDQDVDARLKAAASAAASHDERLATVEKDLGDNRASLRSLNETAEELEKAVLRLKKTLKELDSTLPRLDSVESRLLRQDDDVAALAQTVKALQQGLQTDLEEIKKFRKEFEQKSERLEGVIDLMNAMRKDINDNSREIVELKQAIKVLENPAQKENGGSFWQKLSRWPWMPALAVGLSAAALGLAASK